MNNYKSLQQVDKNAYSTFSLINGEKSQKEHGGSRFSSYKIELQNRVTQSDVTLRVTNSKIFLETVLSSY